MNYLVAHHQSLKKYHTLALDVQAALVYFPLNTQGLIEILNETHEKRRIVIGKGSNLFFRKARYDENTVFILTILMDDIVYNGRELIVEAGVSLQRLAWFAVEQGLKNYAFCEDIPGTVGGALIMNAGQYEYTIGQNVNWIELYDLDTSKVKRIVPDSAFFQYRHSHIQDHDVILRASLKSETGDTHDELEKILTYKRDRYRKQPRNYPNAGSVFKRPVKDGETLYVWKLLEACDLRGFVIGGAAVSDKHPGFIVNVDHASLEDIDQLIKECQHRVKERFDVELELEWKVLE